jgi:hypothetical protein
LNLLREEEAGVPQFFSPQRVLAAKAYQEGKEEAVKEEKRQRAIRKEEATAKRKEVQETKEERKIQRQLAQEAISERKIAAKAQKAQEREERRLEKERRDQEKALLTIQRKKEREMLQQLTVATKKARTPKAQSKRASTGPSNSFKGPINPIYEAIKATKGLQATPSRSTAAGSCPIAGVRDLTVAKAPNTNRRGRRVALPQRFRE